MTKYIYFSQNRTYNRPKIYFRDRWQSWFSVTYSNPIPMYLMCFMCLIIYHNIIINTDNIIYLTTLRNYYLINFLYRKKTSSVHWRTFKCIGISMDINCTFNTNTSCGDLYIDSKTFAPKHTSNIIWFINGRSTCTTRPT